MEKLAFIKEAKRSTHSLVWQLILQGILLMVLGVIIVYQPKILILLAAFILIMVGILSVWAGYKVWKFVRKLDKFFNLF